MTDKPAPASAAMEDALVHAAALHLIGHPRLLVDCRESGRCLAGPGAADVLWWLQDQVDRNG